MDTLEFKIQVMKKKTTITKLAQNIGCTREWLSQVVNNPKKSSQVWEKAIKKLNELPEAA
jgi:hypothetical protein